MVWMVTHFWQWLHDSNHAIDLGIWLSLAFMFWAVIMNVNILSAKQVGKLLVWGVPQPGIVRTGWYYLLWLPKWWDGHRPYELVRFPKDPISLEYEGKNQTHYVFSKDGVALLARFFCLIRLPYEEDDSLTLLCQSGKSFDDRRRLAQELEGEVIAGGREAALQFTAEQILSRQNIKELNIAMRVFLQRPDGLFAMIGICGNNCRVVPNRGEPELIP
ncbi:MAG: hypothetical protein NT094_02915, partial [Candidatus Staskawiczbacteria bacterium]|nr:hypothetical protein [Candidatus Staskawiczbacteria bacterium]